MLAADRQNDRQIMHSIARCGRPGYTVMHCVSKNDMRTIFNIFYSL